MPTQYDILRYLQDKEEENIAILHKKFGVATSKKLRLLKNAGMIEYRTKNIICLSKNVTDAQILSKKPTVVGE